MIMPTIAESQSAQGRENREIIIVMSGANPKKRTDGIKSGRYNSATKQIKTGARRGLNLENMYTYYSGKEI